jgi:hypothetical protein
MDCLGSVLLFRKESAYCTRCPLKNACEDQVAENRIHLEEALRKPVFDADGKFWVAAQKKSVQKKALATHLSSAAAAVKPAELPPEVKPVEPKVMTPAALGHTLEPSEAMRLEGLPTKVRQEVERWMKKSVDLTSIAIDVNPFIGIAGTDFATDFTDAYLRMPGKPSKKAIGIEIENIRAARGQAAMTPASLQSNVNIVSGAYKACGYNLIAE